MYEMDSTIKLDRLVRLVRHPTTASFFIDTDTHPLGYGGQMVYLIFTVLCSM